MIQCFIKAGFPAGVVQAVTGRGGEIGDYLTTHPEVNGISFTGGETGVRVAQKAGMVALQTELGGKDACIVLPDADLDLAKYLCSNIYSSTFVTFTRRVLRKYRNGRTEVDKLRIHQLATIRSGKSSISNATGSLL